MLFKPSPISCAQGQLKTNRKINIRVLKVMHQVDVLIASPTIHRNYECSAFMLSRTETENENKQRLFLTRHLFHGSVLTYPVFHFPPPASTMAFKIRFLHTQFHNQPTSLVERLQSLATDWHCENMQTRKVVLPANLIMVSQFSPVLQENKGMLTRQILAASFNITFLGTVLAKNVFSQTKTTRGLYSPHNVSRTVYCWCMMPI